MTRIDGSPIQPASQAHEVEATAPSQAAHQAEAAHAPAAGLTLGARGAAVESMQRDLIALGYGVPGGADGIFGRGTATALAGFQRKAGLPTTGQADAATLAKLAGAAASKYPPVATAASALVLANAKASDAMSQMDMVAGSVEINGAADELLRQTAEELASQYADRGKDAKGAAVMADLEKFMKQVGPARGYRVDPERGSMASLEDNGARMTKVMARLDKLSKELGAVNKEPSGEFQQAYNRSAHGDAVMQEARYALAFQKAFDEAADPKVLAEAKAFLGALPRKIDGQVESRGGTMEPLERSGGAAAALAEATKALGGK